MSSKLVRVAVCRTPSQSPRSTCTPLGAARDRARVLICTQAGRTLEDWRLRLAEQQPEGFAALARGVAPRSPRSRQSPLDRHTPSDARGRCAARHCWSNGVPLTATTLSRGGPCPRHDVDRSGDRGNWPSCGTQILEREQTSTLRSAQSCIADPAAADRRWPRLRSPVLRNRARWCRTGGRAARLESAGGWRACGSRHSTGRFRVSHVPSAVTRSVLRCPRVSILRQNHHHQDGRKPPRRMHGAQLQITQAGSRCFALHP